MHWSRIAHTPSAAYLHRGLDDVGCLRSIATPPPPPSSNELTVLLRTGPGTWFVGADDQGAGIDYDLAHMFAEQEGLTLKVVPTGDPVDKLADAGAGPRFGAGSLYLPGSRVVVARKRRCSIRRATTPSNRC